MVNRDHVNRMRPFFAAEATILMIPAGRTLFEIAAKHLGGYILKTTKPLTNNVTAGQKWRCSHESPVNNEKENDRLVFGPYGYRFHSE